MTLMRPTVKGENISTTSDRNGRVLIVNLTIQDEEFCLANIYAPNDQNLQVDFYTQLTRKLRQYVNSNLVLGGDFNCPLENIARQDFRITPYIYYAYSSLFYRTIVETIDLL